jgi:hypothetical protein
MATKGISQEERQEKKEENKKNKMLKRATAVCLPQLLLA